MSWQLFKSNMKRVMDRPQTVKSIDDFAKLFADEYDSAVKRGSDLVHQTKLRRGNKQSLEIYTQIALRNGLSSKSSSFNLVNELGKAVVTYWIGAEFYEYPIPTLPAPGSISNTGVSYNRVINPGQWPSTPSIIPNTKTDIILDIFTLMARQHLLQVSGIIQTVSTYPPNGTPAPGFINWTGYLVPS